MATYASLITQQSKTTNGLKMNYDDEATVNEFGSKENFQRAQYQFQLNVDIRITKQKPITQGYGKTVYEVEWIDQDGPPIVLLQIDGAKAIQEAAYYVQLSCHSHIIRTYGLVQNELGSLMLLQEFAPQGNLSDLLRGNEFTPNERVLWEIFEQICDAMIFLAAKNIIHGDLACRNILVIQMNPINPKKNFVKLTDFGLTSASKLYSVIDSPDLTTMTIIHARYAAPELLRDLNKLNYSEKSDVYSMGVLMWEACANGKLPYSNIDDSETIRQHKLKDKKLSKPTICSKQLWAIINECWKLEPNNRPSFQSLKESISDLQPKLTEKSKREIIPNVNIDRTVIPLQLNKTDDLRNDNFEDYRGNNNNAVLINPQYERFYSDQESLDSHETSNVSNGPNSCPFCQECLSSPMDLHDHLILCGTKTDQCPNCRQFIQRAIFAYHYENNCASIDPSSDQRTQLQILNNNNSSERIQCEFCGNNCVRSDYQLHKNSCVRNPNLKNLSTRSSNRIFPSASPNYNEDQRQLDGNSDHRMRSLNPHVINLHPDDHRDPSDRCCVLN